MSDIKLFQITPESISELAAQSAQIEKSLQLLIEANLEALLGIKFLASEHSTGPVHGGRIDTLGIDEDSSPAIIEYKRAVSENVINQGLFYLDWLMDHKKEFQWLVMERLGADAAKAVDWSTPRLVCIAGDFTRYDGHAVKQIHRNIELIRYRRFGAELLMIEQIHTTKIAKAPTSSMQTETASVSNDNPTLGKDPYFSQLIEYRLANSSKELRDIFEAVSSYLTGLGDDVQIKQVKYYVAFKRIKNFVCVEIFPQAKIVTCFVKLNPETVLIEKGFTRDVRNIGHYGTGDLEIILRSLDDLSKAQPLFQRAYEGG